MTPVLPFILSCCDKPWQAIISIEIPSLLKNQYQNHTFFTFDGIELDIVNDMWLWWLNGNWKVTCCGLILFYLYQMIHCAGYLIFYPRFLMNFKLVHGIVHVRWYITKV